MVTVDPRTDLYTRSGELQDDLVTGKVFRTKDWSFNELFYAVYRKLKPDRGGVQSSSTATAAVNKDSIFSRIFRQLLCFPDEVILWRFASIRKINQIVREEKPDVIFSSSLPNTVHLIANKLSKAFDIPWVADFRDLWTQNPYMQRTGMLLSWEEHLEQRVLNRADAMITISDGLKEDLESRYQVPVFAIPNGFDPDEVESDGATRSEGIAEDRFTLTFTGTIYPGKRDPSPLFEAMLILKDEGRLGDDEMLIRFYGRKQEFIAELLAGRFSGLKNCVELSGAVPREEALQAQRDSTALLLLEWVDPRAQGVYTGKIFEYLAANRPILSIGPEGGVLERLIDNTRTGFQATDPQIIADKLSDWLRTFRENKKIEHDPDLEEIAQYSRKRQTETLAEILLQVTYPANNFSESGERD